MKKNYFSLAWLTYISAVIILLSGCSVERRCERAKRDYEMKAYKLGCALPFIDAIHDSIVIAKHDTTVILKVEKEYYSDTIRMDSELTTPKSILNTKYAISTAWVDSGLLQHFLEQKQTNTPITIKDAIQATTATKETIIRVPYPVEVKAKLNTFQKTLISSGGLILFAFLCWCATRLRKLFLP